MYAKKLIENLGENWLDEQAARSNVLTSFEMSCVAGLDKYTSALKLWSMKTGKIQPEAQSVPMWLAVRLRPVMVNLYKRQSGRRLKEVNSLFMHPEFSFAACNPDGIIMNDDNTEGSLLKVTKVHERQFKSFADEIPLKHLVRMTWEMGIMGLESCELGVLSSGDEFQILPVEFTSDAWDQCLQLAAKFLDCVQKDIPPNAGPGDRKLIEKIVGERTETPIDLTGDKEVSQFIDKVAEYGDKRRALNREVKDLEAQEKEFENRIMMKMGKSSVAMAQKFGASGNKPVALTVKKTVVAPCQRAGYEFTQLRIK